MRPPAVSAWVRTPMARTEYGQAYYDDGLTGRDLYNATPARQPASVIPADWQSGGYRGNHIPAVAHTAWQPPVHTQQAAGTPAIPTYVPTAAHRAPHPEPSRPYHKRRRLTR